MVLTVALVVAAMMVAAAMPAFAAITKTKPGKGNPATNPAGKCRAEPTRMSQETASLTSVVGSLGT
jgi:hypothetical protein